jgi:branched-chain amino acid transport system substrate-binding protein
MKVSQYALVAATLCLSGAAVAADTIKIGSLLPVTGGSAALGTAVRDGQRLAIAQLNAKGGVLGKQLELVELDDEAKPETGTKNMHAMLGKGIVACACGVNTGVVAGYQPMLQAAKIPNVIPASAGTKLTKNFANAPEGNYTFRVQASDTLQAQMMVDYAIKKGYKKIALLSDATPYGIGGRDDMVKQLATHDARAVAASTFNLKEADMTPHLVKARDAGAQVLLVYGIGPEQGSIAAANAKLGMRLPIIGSWPNATDSFIDAAGAAGEGAFSPQTFVEGSSLASGREFEAAYRAQYNRTRIINPTAAAGGHDAILLIAAAIKQANSTDGAKVKAALENLATPVAGAIATYNKPFSPDDHEAINLSSALMAMWKKGAIVRAPL